ncbi:hypothetical protein ABII15_00165 [Streptomyces sp. HUAS MG91]|uniref:Uncharacterized protein n=1 Tax=Streptomyces tabacisoli TaxID=3156398 RepID=A0AAU8IJV3_9ACTN
MSLLVVSFARDAKSPASSASLHGPAGRDCTRLLRPDGPALGFGGLAGAQCNQALILLNSDEFDRAAAAIRPVLKLSPAIRNNGVIVSVLRVRQALMAGPARTALTFRSLTEELAAYPP